MPKQITEIRSFLQIARRKDARSAERSPGCKLLGL